MYASKLVPSYITHLESEGRRDLSTFCHILTDVPWISRLDINDAPGFSLKSDQSFSIGPLLLCLAFDSYFKGLIVHDIPRKETIPEIAQVIKDNNSLAKIVASNVDGDVRACVLACSRRDMLRFPLFSSARALASWN